jgi:PhnB protein
MKKKAKKKAVAKKVVKAVVKTKVSPVPQGYHTVTPYLTVRDAAQAIDFYKRAFGAKELMRMPGPDGKNIMHAELRIGDSIVMLSDENPGMSTSHAPTTLGGTTCVLFLYVPNVDAAFKRAEDAGCKVLKPLADMFWGDRYGQLEDPFGNQWALATHKEDVTPKEMNRRAQAAMAQRPSNN